MSNKRLSRQIILTLFLSFTLLQAHITVFAQENSEVTADTIHPTVRFTHLTSDEGLAQNTVEAIFQDSRGFMWFGTPSGLSRYDGYTFKTYVNDPDDPTSLGGNRVRGINEDREGYLWFGSEGGGVSRYDPNTDTFRAFRPNPKDPQSLAGDRVLNIFQDSTGNVWVTGVGTTGVNRYDPVTDTFTRYKDVFQGTGAEDMLENPDGTVWLAASRLATYSYETDSFTYYDVPPVNGEKDERVVVIHRAADGTVWAGGTNGLYRFDEETQTFTNYPQPRGINEMVEDDKGRFWIASSDGLYIFDYALGQVVYHFQNDPYHADSLSVGRAQSIFRDKAGVIWVGMDNGGVNVIDPRQMEFTYYRHDPSTTGSIAEGNINAFLVDDKRLWVAVSGTLDLIDRETGEIKHYTPPIGGNINMVLQDHEGLIWVGMTGMRLFSFDPATEEFTPYPFESAVTRQTPAKSIVDLHEDEAGNLWVAVNQDGLYKFDASRENVQFYEGPPSYSSILEGADPATAPRPTITDIFVDSDGYFWVTTLNGVNRFDPNTGVYDQYRAREGDSGADSHMETTYQDSKGRIWLASRDGLILLNLQREPSLYYRMEDGLPANNLVGILEDDKGNLWISSKRGIARFNPDNPEVNRNFTISDGLQGSEFNTRAFAEAPDGQMFFGGPNGITAFYPDQITENIYQAPVVLTNFELNNEVVEPEAGTVLEHPITETDSLTLDYDQNIITFGFSSLSYSAPQRNHYWYQLENFDDEWIPRDSTRRFATYTTLPAGDYVFRVKGTNSSGVESTQTVALKLTILPPWWATTWFRSVVAIGLIAAVIGGIQWRVYSVRRRNRELESEVARQTHVLQERAEMLQNREEQLRHAKDAAESANRAKSAFLANMSHELRSPLNVILGFTQVMHRNSALPRDSHENLGIILRSGEHLLGLINQVLDLSKIEAGHMTLNETDFDLHRLLDDLEDMFILKAEDKQLQLLIDHAEDVPHYLRADNLKLRQVLINLVNNAMKFTQRGGITVRVRRLAGEPMRLQFEVEDTGIGISPEEMTKLFEAFSQTSSGKQAQEGTGLGLTISRRFTQLMGGEITVKSNVGTGTIFTFDVQCREGQPVEDAINTQIQHIVGLEADQPNYRILVVDDKWANRQLLNKLLTPLGFEVREAENGKEAIEIAGVFEPHLIWMDMRMPVMDGIEATQRLKATSIGKNAVIIALTASAFDEEREDVLSAGCDDFLRKPFRTEDIFSMLAKHLKVRYVYAQDEVVKEAEPTPTEDLHEAVAGLSPELVTRLTEGIELGDGEMLERVFADIRAQNATLSDALARYASRFEYDKLLALVREPLKE